jgi:hypothetical protein
MTILEAERIRMPFGKHRNLTLAEIAAVDVLYLDWLAGLTNLDAYLREAIDLLCKKHERAIDKAMETGGRREYSDRRQGRLFG